MKYFHIKNPSSFIDKSKKLIFLFCNPKNDEQWEAFALKKIVEKVLLDVSSVSFHLMM